MGLFFSFLNLWLKMLMHYTIIMMSIDCYNDTGGNSFTIVARDSADSPCIS